MLISARLVRSLRAASSRDALNNPLQVVQGDFNDSANDKVLAALAVRGLPTTVLIDAEGKIARMWLGAATADNLRAAGRGAAGEETG